jgi:hypothetical protein
VTGVHHGELRDGGRLVLGVRRCRKKFGISTSAADRLPLMTLFST